jgi:hypothetical protein
MFLPLAFLDRFLTYARTRARPYKDLDAALRNWIKSSSPAGSRHRAAEWEAACARARVLESQSTRARVSESEPVTRGTWVPAVVERGPVHVSRCLEPWQELLELEQKKGEL